MQKPYIILLLPILLFACSSPNAPLPVFYESKEHLTDSANYEKAKEELIKKAKEAFNAGRLSRGDTIHFYVDSTILYTLLFPSFDNTTNIPEKLTEEFENCDRDKLLQFVNKRYKKTLNFHMLIDVTHENNTRDPVIQITGEQSFRDDNYYNGYGTDLTDQERALADNDDYNSEDDIPLPIKPFILLSEKDLQSILIRNDLNIYIKTIEDDPNLVHQQFEFHFDDDERKQCRGKGGEVDTTLFKNKFEERTLKKHIDNAMDRFDRNSSMIFQSIVSTLIPVNNTRDSTHIYVFSDLEQNDGKLLMNTTAYNNLSRELQYIENNNPNSYFFEKNIIEKNMIITATGKALNITPKEFIQSMDLSHVTITFLRPPEENENVMNDTERHAISKKNKARNKYVSLLMQEFIELFEQNTQLIID